MYGYYSVRYFCVLFGKSRQAWYEQRHSLQNQQLSDALVLKLVAEIRQELPRLGVSKLQYMLSEPMAAHGIKMGRDALYELLGQHGYLIRYRRRKPYTTDSNHAYKKYPNLIRELLLTHPGQLWVSDITYLRLMKGFCYLSTITDAYSRKIVVYKLHATLHSQGPIDALNMAAKESKRQASLIHHSDRGTQYCCSDYVQVINGYNIRLSMTEKGDPYENAIAERINGILKGEFELNKTFTSLAEACSMVDQAVQKYNQVRPHASCDYLTPERAHEQNGILKKRWRNKVYRQKVVSGQISTKEE
ncbi:MAG: IS3 family transposase [Daejeonella sp.]